MDDDGCLISIHCQDYEFQILTSDGICMLAHKSPLSNIRFKKGLIKSLQNYDIMNQNDYTIDLPPGESHNFDSAPFNVN